MNLQNLNVSNEIYMDVMDEIMNYPFNTSQVGFAMLVKTITKIIEAQIPLGSLETSTLKEVAEEFKVSVKTLEKLMRDAMVVASYNCKYNEVIYPNVLIQSALGETKVKSFVMAMSYYINNKRMRNIIK